jgi:two-component system chemotaxis response regulator CheY
MKTLIIEDDLTCRLTLQSMLAPLGECHATVNGVEALQAFRLSREQGRPYDLICLDVMMPQMNGQEALREIRQMEETVGTRSTRGVKIIMITSLNDPRNVMQAFYELCDAYLVKPVDKTKLYDQIRAFGLFPG